METSWFFVPAEVPKQEDVIIAAAVPSKHMTIPACA